MHRSIVRIAKKSSLLFRPLASRFSFRSTLEDPSLNAVEWNSLLLCAFVLFASCASVIAFALLSSLFLSMLLGVFSSYLTVSGIVFFAGMNDRRRVSDFEDRLPAALDLLVAQYRSSGDMVDAMAQVGKSNLYPLNSFFSDIAAEIKSGMGYLPTLSNAMKVTSRNMRRVLRLLLLCLEKGSDVSYELQRISEDIIEEKHMIERKKSVVSKDVLLLCFVFCIIVPFIYALSLNLLYLFSHIENTGKVVEIPALRALLLLSLPFHGYFISMIAGELLRDNSTEGIVYLPPVAILSISVFLLSERVLFGLYGF